MDSGGHLFSLCQMIATERQSCRESMTRNSHRMHPNQRETVLTKQISRDPMNRKQSRYKFGIWLMMRNNSAGCCKGKAEGVFRAREVRRLEPQRRWNKEFMLLVQEPGRIEAARSWLTAWRSGETWDLDYFAAGARRPLFLMSKGRDGRTMLQRLDGEKSSRECIQIGERLCWQNRSPGIQWTEWGPHRSLESDVECETTMQGTTKDSRRCVQSSWGQKFGVKAQMGERIRVLSYLKYHGESPVTGRQCIGSEILIDHVPIPPLMFDAIWNLPSKTTTDYSDHCRTRIEEHLKKQICVGRLIHWNEEDNEALTQELHWNEERKENITELQKQFKSQNEQPQWQRTWQEMKWILIQIAREIWLLSQCRWWQTTINTSPCSNSRSVQWTSTGQHPWWDRVSNIILEYVSIMSRLSRPSGKDILSWILMRKRFQIVSCLSWICTINKSMTVRQIAVMTLF